MMGKNYGLAGQRMEAEGVTLFRLERRSFTRLAAASVRVMGALRALGAALAAAFANASTANPTMRLP